MLEADKSKEARTWRTNLDLAKNEDKLWLDRSDKIVRRYREGVRVGVGGVDSGNAIDGYNILWSNIQTMLPAMYGRTPKAQVERRWKDQDPAGRTASTIIERCLQFEIDHYGDFDSAVKDAVLDRLLPGRGVCWVRFENKEIATADQEEVSDTAPNAAPNPVVEAENGVVEAPPIPYSCTPVDYVFWKDFRCSPARTWDEVTWVARRVYMTRADGVKRFGEKFAKVPLKHEPIGLDALKTSEPNQDVDALKKAIVWEIWDKPGDRVMWLAEGMDEFLDEKSNPFGLDGFWPMPRPLFATQTTDTLVPVPDFTLYQDQANELDKLTLKIGQLTTALKVVGVYDASQPEVARMMSEGVNNTMIPVKNWNALSEKGGVAGAVDWFPLEVVLKTLNECYGAREAAKQAIYEITGLSDIIRGATAASETATAQQIKSNFASLRLKRMQMDVARFASEVLQIKAQMMSDLYSPQQLVEMSGIMGTQDAQHVPAAIQLMKTEPMRAFRIEVATDSLVEMDEQQEKASRMEFLQAAGAFLEKAIPAIQTVPEIAPLMGEMLMFGVRAFKGGRPMEAAFDETVAKLSAPKPPAPPQPDPEMLKVQAQQQADQMRVQADTQIQMARMQADMQVKQAQANADMQIERERMTMQAQLEQARAQLEAQNTERQAMADAMGMRWKAELDAAVRIEVANISAKAKVDNEATQAATAEIASTVTQ